jgi:hypothetical protein
MPGLVCDKEIKNVIKQNRLLGAEISRTAFTASSLSHVPLSVWRGNIFPSLRDDVAFDLSGLEAA